MEQTCQRISLLLGQLAAWLLLVMLLLTVILVVQRYIVGTGSIALQELITHCYGANFLLGLSYTLSQNKHVRVDIFYQRFPTHTQDWINALGCLTLLLPFCFFVSFTGFEFFQASANLNESSPEPGGLPYLYLYKGLIPLCFSFLLVQGLLLFFTSAKRLIFIR